MAFDGDIVQIKTFSENGKTDAVISLVENEVNKYLRNYPADLCHSIQAQVTETVVDSIIWFRYTVTVVLRA